MLYFGHFINLNDMANKIIPTAEEFLEDNLSNPTKGWSEKKRLIEFAKLHVEAALKTASKKTTYGMLVVPLFNEDQREVILNSYPLENIK